MGDNINMAVTVEDDSPTEECPTDREKGVKEDGHKDCVKGYAEVEEDEDEDGDEATISSHHHANFN